MAINNSIWNLKISDYRGIQIRLHASFLLIPLWFSFEDTLSQQTALTQLLFVAAYLSALCIHEAAHFLAALINRSQYRSMTIYPSGSSVIFSREPAARSDLFYAFSGICANLLAAMLAFYIWSPPLTLNFNRPYLAGFLISNCALALLNLIPVFPLDGWRIFKSILAVLQVRRVTLITARLNHILALSTVAFAIALSNPWLMIFGVLLGVSSIKEHIRVKAAEAALGLTVEEVMIPRENLICLNHGITLSRAMGTVIKSFQGFFPVIHNNQILGLLEREHFMRSLASGQSEDYISSLMRRDMPTFAKNEKLSDIMDKVINTNIDCSIVLNDRKEFVGLLVREKIIEYLLLERAFEESKNQDISDEFFL